MKPLVETNTSSRLHVSINRSIVSKPKSDERKGYATGFEPHELTLKDLARAVCTHGHAFSYVFKGGHRKTQNFLGADFLAVDVDHGLTIDAALKDDFVKKHCSLL